MTHHSDTSPTTSDECRRAFEIELLKREPRARVDFFEGKYASAWTQFDWETWQTASRTGTPLLPSEQPSREGVNVNAVRRAILDVLNLPGQTTTFAQLNDVFDAIRPFLRSSESSGMDASENEGCPHFGKAVDCDPKKGGCIAIMPSSVMASASREEKTGEAGLELWLKFANRLKDWFPGFEQEGYRDAARYLSHEFRATLLGEALDMPGIKESVEAAMIGLPHSRKAEAVLAAIKKRAGLA